MPSETYAMIGAALAVLVALWLVFKVLRKLFGVALLAAVALAVFVLWSNPEIVRSITRMGASLLG